MLSLGANTTIRNNEKQLPYDLSAKNPEVGRLLMIRGESLHLASLLTDRLEFCKNSTVARSVQYIVHLISNFEGS